MKKRTVKDRNTRSKRAPHALHKINPAGTKMLLRWFKAKHGYHASTTAEAYHWYADYLSEQDKKARLREVARKLARVARDMQP